MEDRDSVERRGVADPEMLRGYLETVDAAVLQMESVRTTWMNQVEDAFTVLRSSAQIFREIFFGVELPIESPMVLIERAGGPYRLIRVSYKETGTKVFALADVIAAIPHFAKCFPVKDFHKLAEQLEGIREHEPEAEAVWFVNEIENKHLAEALKREAEILASGKRTRSPLVQPPPRFEVCTCCGEAKPPAKLIADAFAAIPFSPGVSRWTGRRNGSGAPAKSKTGTTTRERRRHDH